MYTVQFGYGWKYRVETESKASAEKVAEALTFKGWSARITDPQGITLPWRT